MADSIEKPAATTSLPSNPLLRYLFPAGIGVGAIVAYYLYQVFTAEPAQSFGLLRAWGPWWLLSVMACYFAGTLLNRGLVQMEKMSDGMQKMALAVSEIAAKDDRQFEEMRLLTQYSARQNDRLVELMEKNSQQLETMAQAQNGLRATLERLQCHPDSGCMPAKRGPQDGK
jgi:hypothetical protein